MLEFVHLTGPEAGKDEQTRRKVRSQAMRDFRRRQRAEHDRRNVAPPPSGSRTRERVTSDVSTLGGRAPMPTNVKRSHSPSTMRQSGSTSNTSFIEWNANESVASPDPATNTERSWPQPHTDVQENEMFSYCKSYLHWLCPEVDSTMAAAVLTSRTDLEHSPTSLAALCLASVGHLDAVRGDQSSLDYALCKARVFQNINERMTLPNGTVSNETVAYLACLLSYEMSNCSPEAILHLQGLHSIIKLRGGMATLDAPLGMMLECLDLCHSILFQEKPVLALMDNPKAWTINVEQHLGNCNSLVRLLRQEADNFYRETPDACPYKQRLRYTPQLMQDIIDVMQFLGPIPDFWRTVDIPQEVVAPYQQRLEAARALTFDADPQHPEAHLLARIVYLRILLTFKLDVLRIHPELPEIQGLIDGIRATIQSISEAAWRPWPYLRLWTILAAIHLAKTPSLKGFFKAHLVKSVFRMGVDEWPRAKTFIVRFLSARSMFMTFRTRTQPGPVEQQEPHQLTGEASPGSLPWTIPLDSLDDYLGDAGQAGTSMSTSVPTTLHHSSTTRAVPSIFAPSGVYSPWSAS